MSIAIDNLSNMSWWLNVLFTFIALGTIRYLFKVLSTTARGISRKNRQKRAYKIKNIRQDDVLVTREIIKEYTFLLIFVLASIILIGWYVRSPFLDSAAPGSPLFFILTSPIYILEIVYLIQAGFVSSVQQSRKKLK